LRVLGYGADARAHATPGVRSANSQQCHRAHERFGDAGNFERAIVYTSTQAHHSVAKAVRLAAFPRDVRTIDVETRFE